MAWHRYRRERRDYCHLDGLNPRSAFDQAYRLRTFGRDLPTWPALVNDTLIRLFAGVETLDRAGAIAAVVADRAAKGKRGPGTPGAFDGDVAGNAMAWGVHLKLLVATEGEDGTTWGMPDRQPWYEVQEGGRLRQVRGMTEAEAAAQARLDQIRARRSATLQAKEAARVGPLVEAELHRILRHDPDFVIREGNPRGSYPDKDIALFLPTVAAPIPLVEVLPIALEAHHDMEPRQQRQWLTCLEAWAWEVRYQAQRARTKAIQAEEAAARAAVEAVDDAALEDL